ncbi:MAG: hydantoinase B/oxoprolinase family protein [Candidatus Latescibacterota bacterium]|nr:hydantoinase B/oxoprolinase family protein [Candidatus Latescibacterota bacterium]
MTALNDWKIWIDTGGTFTDCLARSPSGFYSRTKVLSTSALRGQIIDVLDDCRIKVACDWPLVRGLEIGFSFVLLQREGAPKRYVVECDLSEGLMKLDGPLSQGTCGIGFEIKSPQPAPILAAQLVTGSANPESLPRISMRLGTTRGTNALLEKQGVRVALFVTKGFSDVLQIGTQSRPDLFSLDIRKTPPLYTSVVEVDERIDSHGKVISVPVLNSLREKVEELLGDGINTVAISFVNSHVNSIHEAQVANYLMSYGMQRVICSADRVPFIKYLQRTQTTVVDAFIGPIVDDYLSEIESGINNGSLHVMTSAGGLVPNYEFRAKDSLLSGPAGGVVGAIRAGRLAGFNRIISFDMGGTSTDVARFDHEYEYVFEHHVGDAHVVAPALSIETIAAGGGSICSVHSGCLKVGPESAGAVPGPACYGAGGPLTLTDINLLLGRLNEKHFGIPINRSAAEIRFNELLEKVCDQTSTTPSKEEILEGFISIAEERMADAVHRVSLEKGYDPEEYALVAFGGAGGQHACGVAQLLGIKTVVIPEDAGLLSALGIGHALVERFAEMQILENLSLVAETLPKFIEELAQEARSKIEKEGISDSVVSRRIVQLRFVGQDQPLSLEWQLDLETAFLARYEQLYGHSPESKEIEIVSLRVVVSSLAIESPITDPRARKSTWVGFDGFSQMWIEGKWVDASVYDRLKLQIRENLVGPALIFESHSATFISNEWDGLVHDSGSLILEHKRRVSTDYPKKHESIRLELFVNGLRSIAEEMGTLLQRTALSTNVKERLDFSCGILDRRGNLIVNAPHIPVHLGALGMCVRSVIDTMEMKPGDTVLTNHPGFGGSHLPDITLISPVFVESQLIGYVANRAHHAELGGIRPGSMPPDAHFLFEEGVVIDPMYIVKSGKVIWGEVRALLIESPYPSRSIESNIADLAAALAANARGTSAFEALANRYGLDDLETYMNRLWMESSQGVKKALKKLGDGIYSAKENLDDGTAIVVNIEVENGNAFVDWTGTGGVHSGSLNATPAIVRSAVLYVLRVMVDEPLPLNEGMMEGVRIKLPFPSLLSPDFNCNREEAPAVMGGNVETSQRLVSVLLRAFGLCAGSQPTMNNILFGTEDFGYYETVCGGTGAGPGYDGTDAVHSHMTNTRITDVEIIEHRYPIRVERFSIRNNSGGAGFWKGGNGVIRELTFLQPMELSLVTQGRIKGAYGLEGGEAGALGRQLLIRQDGSIQELRSLEGISVQSGDKLVMETPGGGGYGKSNEI